MTISFSYQLKQAYKAQTTVINHSNIRLGHLSSIYKPFKIVTFHWNYGKLLLKKFPKIKKSARMLHRLKSVHTVSLPSCPWLYSPNWKSYPLHSERAEKELFYNNISRLFLIEFFLKVISRKKIKTWWDFVMFCMSAYMWPKVLISAHPKWPW